MGTLGVRIRAAWMEKRDLDAASFPPPDTRRQGWPSPFYWCESKDQRGIKLVQSHTASWSVAELSYKPSWSMSAPEPAVAWHLLILSSFLPQIFWRPLLLATVPAFPFWSLGDACMRAKSLQSYPTLYDPMDCSSPGWGFSGKNTGLPCPLPGDLPNPGIEPISPCLMGCRQILYPLSHLGNL